LGWVLLVLLIVVVPVASLIAMGMRCRRKGLFVLATVGGGVLIGMIAAVVLREAARDMGPDAGMAAVCLFAIGTLIAAMLGANVIGAVVLASTRRRPWERGAGPGPENGTDPLR